MQREAFFPRNFHSLSTGIFDIPDLKSLIAEKKLNRSRSRFCDRDHWISRSRSSCDFLTKWRSPIAIAIAKKRSRSTIKRSPITHALFISMKSSNFWHSGAFIKQIFFYNFIMNSVQSFKTLLLTPLEPILINSSSFCQVLKFLWKFNVLSSFSLKF